MSKIRVLIHKCININELDIDGSVYAAGTPGLASYVYNDFALKHPEKEQLISEFNLHKTMTLHTQVQHDLDYLIVYMTVMMTPEQFELWEKLCFIDKLSN